ncbi:uncharacterized protein LOC124173525 [Ischnura elegans]|uniref:uncharacterized protein LOC124173525 n=1 Tax=Ischnura elegans TaxID=197161 RepID=UPI001ED8663E|nr:uncharacterized protein LOC124173525 [Ischnura elegans]
MRRSGNFVFKTCKKQNVMLLTQPPKDLTSQIADINNPQPSSSHSAPETKTTNLDPKAIIPTDTPQPSQALSVPIVHPAPITNISTDGEKIQWTRAATFALLDAYVKRNIECDRSKKNKTFWQHIAQDVRISSDIEYALTGDQVRWKFSALKKSYHRTKDHNRVSGNDPRRLDEFEERMAEILGDRTTGGGDSFTFSSPMPNSGFSLNPTGESSRKTQELDCPHSEKTSSTPAQSPVATPTFALRKRGRGTGSKTARTKLELERQWLLHLQKCETRADDQKSHQEKLCLLKEERNKHMKEQLELRKKELQLQTLKLTKKMDRHKERMALEKEKIDLLRQLMNKKGDLFL